MKKGDFSGHARVLQPANSSERSQEGFFREARMGEVKEMIFLSMSNSLRKSQKRNLGEIKRVSVVGYQDKNPSSIRKWLKLQGNRQGCGGGVVGCVLWGFLGVGLFVWGVFV